MTLRVLPHSRFVKAQWKGFDFAMLGFVQWKDEAKITLPPLVGLPTIHCRRTLHVLPQSQGLNNLLITRVAVYIILFSNSLLSHKIFSAKPFLNGMLIFMLSKIIILIILIVYIVLSIQNLCRKDSDLLVERLYKFLKDLYYTLLYG